MGKGYEFDLDSLLRVDDKVDEPSMYKVFLHNDDYTSMDFVVQILVDIFHMNHKKATSVMLAVHNSGIGECGIYVYDIARTKVDQVHMMATANGFPLKASMKEEK